MRIPGKSSDRKQDPINNMAHEIRLKQKVWIVRWRGIGYLHPYLPGLAPSSIGGGEGSLGLGINSVSSSAIVLNAKIWQSSSNGRMLLLDQAVSHLVPWLQGLDSNLMNNTANKHFVVPGRRLKAMWLIARSSIPPFVCPIKNHMSVKKNTVFIFPSLVNNISSG